MINFKSLTILLLFALACKSPGNLTLEGSINNSLEEVSAAETSHRYSDVIWTIEDSGNDNDLIALNKRGKILQYVAIENAKNKDWEDLTSDTEGNIYIGDFGNNGEDREEFKIYKVSHKDLNKKTARAEVITFTLPDEDDSKDFESFFIYNNYFYIISKASKDFIVFKVPNTIGQHKAKIVSQYNFEGKDNKITSADISSDGKTIVFLNHDKLWKVSNFNGEDFFSGTIEKLVFNNNTQKEGICFSNNSSVIITDERDGSEGGNIYSFSWKP